MPNTICMVSLRDISDLKEAEQIRTDFVANVSHELRSPLTALSGFIETLSNDPQLETDARSRFLDLMDMEAGRMVRLIDDLLSLSRVEAHQRQKPRGKVDLKTLLSRIISSVQPQAEKEKKQLKLVADNTDKTVAGDIDELTQVFQNLIENAIKYGRRNSTITISVLSDQKVPYVNGLASTVVVEDQGEGFSAHHIPRLTERFYRVDSHRSRNKGGTGLGLAIVKHIVTRHRGRLKIESEPGTGSRFSVSLPQSSN